MNTLLTRMQQESDRQRAELCAYSASEKLTLRNKHLSAPAVMTAELTYDRAKGRIFKVTSLQHADALVKHAFYSFLDAEKRMGREHGQSNWIDAAHYKVTLEGIEQVSGRACYRLGLQPREDHPYLLNGHAWVDEQEYAVVRLKGKTEKSLSFWLGKPDVEQDFELLQGFWVPKYSSFLADVKLAGEADLAISYYGYRLQPCSGASSTAHAAR